ncbi:MAG: riboflavin biosynthesis protein RibF [Erysipelothrix sp.]|nr:riboflavin biosynthesis protein RibF [Erysipelothrix sp.]
MKIVHFELNSRLTIEFKPLVAAIGFFDGLHRGHQELVKETLKQAQLKQLVPALITFSPSPQSVLLKQPEKLLTTVEEKAAIAKKLGIEVLIVLRFTPELSQLEPNLFYEKVIKTLNVKHLVCGEDFRFGYKGSGNVDTLRAIEEIGLSVIQDFKYINERISSTIIKKQVEAGSMNVANNLLGYSYELNGFVMHGRKKGRTIGFPTLNLLIEDSKIVPKDGVYIGISIIMGKKYVSTINIGHNPTINTVKHKSIESFVHNYSEDTYGQKVTFYILERIRDEEKFSSVTELIEQMDNDIKVTEEYFTKEQRRAFDIEII